MSHDTFPPLEPPADKAKYRQFLIDHGFDPNLDQEALQRELETKSDAERHQLESDWSAFIASSE